MNFLGFPAELCDIAKNSNFENAGVLGVVLWKDYRNYTYGQTNLVARFFCATVHLCYNKAFAVNVLCFIYKRVIPADKFSKIKNAMNLCGQSSGGQIVWWSVCKSNNSYLSLNSL